MRGSTLTGILLLATGRRAGIERFGDTQQAFLGSMAPLMALLLVGAGLVAAAGHVVLAVTFLLLFTVAQLTPMVVSHWLAARWGLEAAWFRYATAFNWCQWAIPAAGFVVAVAAQLATGGQLSEQAATEVLMGGLGLYGLWLHWFVARHGLQISRWRAAALVAAANAATVALVIGPQLVQLAVNGSTATP